MNNTFISDDVSSVKLSNLQWLEIIDALDEHISTLRYEIGNTDGADKLVVLVDAVYGQLKNGPVAEADFPSVDDIPTLE